MKKIISIILALVTVLSLAACGGEEKQQSTTQPSTLVNEQEAPIEAETLSWASNAYGGDYVKRHLQFLDSQEYQTIRKDYAGLAGEVGNNYMDAKLNYANGAWKGFSTFVAVIGGEEIKVVNEYEILVTELMFSDESITDYAQTFEKSYTDGFIDALKQLSGILREGKTTGDQVDGVEDLCSYLDGVVDLLSKNKVKDGVPATTFFADTMQEVRGKLEQVDDVKWAPRIKKIKTGLKGAEMITGGLSDTLSELVDEYVLYHSFQTASREWEATWCETSSRLRQRSYIETDKAKKEACEKLAESIDTHLQRTKDYRDHNTATVMSRTVTLTGKNALQEAGVFLIEGALDYIPYGDSFKNGLVGGVAVSNMLLNSDDIAYYGQMLVGYGCLAEAMYDIMVIYEGTLKQKKDYNSALFFDQIFEIYKQTQLNAMECTIRYRYAIVDCPIGYVFKYSTDDDVAEIYAILELRRELDPICCHSVPVDNNGGYVVGYEGNVYYFRCGSDARGSTGPFGSFETNWNAEKELIRRDSTGKETVLLKTPSTDVIYICGEKLFYEKYQDGWYSVGLDGTDPKKETGDKIYGYIPQKGLLQVISGNQKRYVTDFDGTKEDLSDAGYVTPEAEFLGSKYYCDKIGAEEFTFYSVDASGKRKNIETLHISAGQGGAIIADRVEGSQGIYYLIGTQEGTGSFFNNGALYHLCYVTGTFRKVCDGINWYEMHYVKSKDGDYILLGTESYAGTGLFDGGIENGVIRLDVTTGQIRKFDAHYRGTGIPYIMHGSLLMCPNHYAATYQDIISFQKAKEYNLGILGVRDDGSALYHEWVHQVGDAYYVLLTEVVPDDASSMGWRQGYRRITSTLYSVSLKGGVLTEIYSY